MKTFICNTKNEFTNKKTRMYSSRMCTSRSSSWVGVYLSAWWDPPSSLSLGVHLETPQTWASSARCGPGDTRKGQTPELLPLGVGLETPPPPQAKPLNSTPLSCGPADLQGMLGYHPPGDLQGMLGYHLQCMLGYHPSCEQNDRDVQKY